MAVAQADAPTVEDARRAADALVAEGAREVWLYGSVARGEAHLGSDIDLMAVFDDVQYRGRYRTEEALGRVAEDASGWRTEVHVTDWPEWRIQREQVRSSFVAAISNDLMLLSQSSVELSEVDWGKAQVMATSNEELALQRLRDTLMNLRKIVALFGPTSAEQGLGDSDDRLDYLELRGTRLIMVCEASHLVVENASKAVAVLSGVDAELQWSHDVGKIIKALGAADATALGALVAAAPGLVKSPNYLTMWRTRGAYGTPTEGRTALEVASPAFASAVTVIACDAADYAARAVSRLIGEDTPDDAAELIERCATLRDMLVNRDIVTGKPRAPKP